MALLHQERLYGGARPAWMVCMAVFFVVLIIGTQRHLDHLNAERSVAGEFRYLPKGDYLKVAVLGYDQLAADLLWLKAIQVMGEKKIVQLDTEWLYQVLDVITTLDPKFDYIYQLGSVYLSMLANRADLAVQLLEKGVVDNPEVWQLHFYLGFNQFYFLGHFKEAADAMAKAAALPGRPNFVPLLASRLYAHAEEPELALVFLEQMYQLSKDDQVRAQLRARMQEVTVERDLKMLDQAVQHFHEQHHRFPVALSELVTAGLLTELPSEPFGGRYYLDPTEKTVKSSKYTTRLHIYGLKPLQGAFP
jgi:hypothetical protein